MSIIIVLISISLLIGLTFLVMFLWNVKNGQFDDTYSPSVRILFEDKPLERSHEKRVESRATNGLSK